MFEKKTPSLYVGASVVKKSLSEIKGYCILKVVFYCFSLILSPYAHHLKAMFYQDIGNNIRAVQIGSQTWRLGIKFVEKLKIIIKSHKKYV